MERKLGTCRTELILSSDACMAAETRRWQTETELVRGRKAKAAIRCS